jgi:hypothetical protein
VWHSCPDTFQLLDVRDVIILSDLPLSIYLTISLAGGRLGPSILLMSVEKAFGAKVPEYFEALAFKI